MRVQRHRTDPESIVPLDCVVSIPQTSDDGDDESIASTSSLDEFSLRFREKLEKANESFTEYRIGKSSLEHLKAEVLRSMCRSRGLDEQGTREDMVARLMDWVRSAPS